MNNIIGSQAKRRLVTGELDQIAAKLPAHFVNYSLVQRADGKIDRIPCDEHGRPIDAHNPANWTDYHTAYERGRAGGLGVGFVLTDGDPYSLVDLDKCALPDRSGYSQAAHDVLAMFGDAAREVSQSGEGLHILGRCDQTVMADRRRKWTTDAGLALECYVSGRFVAFGPYGWQGNPDTDCTAALAALVPARPRVALPDGVAVPEVATRRRGAGTDARQRVRGRTVRRAGERGRPMARAGRRSGALLPVAER